VPPDWYERYGQRIDSWFPRSTTAREALALQMAQDGSALLTALYEGTAPAYLRHLPAVQIVSQVWVQEILYSEDKLALRGPDDLPPAHLRIQSPYETQAHYRT